MSEFIGLIGKWGIDGVLGLGGCYLIVSSIVGKIIRIGKYIPDVPLQFRSRVLLATFGCVLAIPIIWSTYAKAITGNKGTLFYAPSTPEKIESKALQERGAVKENHHYLTDNPLVSFSIAFAQEMVQAQAPCPVVESFGLDQENIRQLKFARFQGEIFVYVGDVHSLSRKPSMVHVIIGEKGSWPTSGHISESEFNKRLTRVSQHNKATLAVQSQGASVLFVHAGQRYKLTVKQLYAVLLGTDAIAVEICQEP